MMLKRLLSAAACLAMLLTSASIPAGSAEPNTTISYQEAVRTINNPGAGYTSTLWYVCKPGDTKVQNPQGNLVLMFVDIGAFSCGANGTKNEDGTYTEGTDYDLDETFFKAMRGTMENCRKNGCTVALRFRYDANGKTDPEPATFEQVLHHIDQIKEDGFLEDYKDILMFVESGFVGAWGEQHSGKYTSLDYKAQLLQAVLNMTPDDIPVTVRTPNTFAKWAGIEPAQLADWVSEPGSDAARVGMYNDGYMGSDSDLGTYANREIETAWLGRQSTAAYYGGEFSGNLDWAKKYDTYLPENAIPEMYQTHLSYINGNIYALYKDMTFGEQYDVSGGDHSAYYGQTVFQFIRDHLGYRFVLRSSDMPDTTEQGGSFALDFSVENTGFANPIRPQKAELILEQNGTFFVTDAGLDSRTWRSCTVSDMCIPVKLPGSIEEGDWNVYLRLSVGDQDIPDGNLRCVEFANDGVWNASLGANLLGSIHVDATKDQTLRYDQHFKANGIDTGNAQLWQFAGIKILDGIRSSEMEWMDASSTETEGNTLYVSNDENYLNVAAEIHHGAEKPVINLRVENDATGKTYWYYRQSAGWIYYSQGSHDGIQLKAKDDFMEFRIPFGEVMGIAPDTLLKKITIFIQDEADEWKGCGTVVLENYTIKPRITTYNSFQTLQVMQGDALTLRTLPAAEDTAIAWKHDDILLDTQGDTLTLRNITERDLGSYTAIITTKDGTTVEQKICEIIDVLAGIRGDLDLDGDVDGKDVLLLQNWLHGKQTAAKGNADLDGDDDWDVFDLAVLKGIAK